MDTVESFIHKGGREYKWLNKKEYEPDLSRCRFSVAEYGRVTDWHQCSRKPVEEIAGYGFCKIHANEVKTRLGIRDDSAKEKYAASFNNGRPNLSKLEIFGETEKVIEIKSVEHLMGSGYGMYAGKSRKQSKYLIGYEFFDTFEEAIAYLYEQSEKNVQSTFLAYEKAIEVRNKLESEFIEFAPKE